MEGGYIPTLDDLRQSYGPADDPWRDGPPRKRRQGPPPTGWHLLAQRLSCQAWQHAVMHMKRETKGEATMSRERKA
jgi:hypothetical protein